MNKFNFITPWVSRMKNSQNLSNITSTTRKRQCFSPKITFHYFISTNRKGKLSNIIVLKFYWICLIVTNNKILSSQIKTQTRPVLLPIDPELEFQETYWTTKIVIKIRILCAVISLTSWVSVTSPPKINTKSHFLSKDWETTFQSILDPPTSKTCRLKNLTGALIFKTKSRSLSHSRKTIRTWILRKAN